MGKETWMCFPYKGQFYLFDHDLVLGQMLERYADSMAVSASWTEKGLYSWKLSKELLGMLKK